MPKKKTMIVKPDRFDSFISQTIFFETGGKKDGALHKDPSDPGLTTKWGISQRAHPKVKIQTLTYTDAVKIYKDEYYSDWIDKIRSNRIAFKLFDMGVLMGPVTATKYLQTAIKQAGGTLIIDGRLGPITINQTNLFPGYELFIEQLKKHIKRIAFTNFLNWYRNHDGWNKRIEFEYKETKIDI